MEARKTSHLSLLKMPPGEATPPKNALLHLSDGRVLELLVEPCETGGVHILYVQTLTLDKINDRLPWREHDATRGQQLYAHIHVELNKFERFLGISLEWKILCHIRKVKKALIRAALNKKTAHDVVTKLSRELAYE